jgi:hypothetical protein
MPVQFSIKARSSRRQDSFLMGALRGAWALPGAGAGKEMPVQISTKSRHYRFG